MKKSWLYSLLCCLALSIPSIALALPPEKIQVLFSPDDRPATTLIELINNAKRHIHVAMYFLTDKPIAEALVNAKQRRVDVCIILDQASTQRFGQAKLLDQNNIPIHVYNTKLKDPKVPTKAKAVLPLELNDIREDRWFGNDPLMHNKYAIIDGQILWTGSFNWTGAANTKNQENVIIIRDTGVCKIYEQHFAKLLQTKTFRYKPEAEPVKRKTPSLRQKIAKALKQTGSDNALLAQLSLLIGKQGPTDYIATQ